MMFQGQQGPPTNNKLMFQASRPYFHQFSNGDDVSVGLDFANMGEAQAFAKEVSVIFLGLGKVIFRFLLAIFSSKFQHLLIFVNTARNILLKVLQIVEQRKERRTRRQVGKENFTSIHI